MRRTMATRTGPIIGIVAGFLPLTLFAGEQNDAVDVQAGEEVYGKCIACHSPDRNRTGPLHCGVVGRVSGTVDGYEYSEAMRAAAITWTVGALDRFLESPLDAVPGTSMGFAGLRDETERRKLIVWLATLTPSSSYCDGVTFEQAGD